MFGPAGVSRYTAISENQETLERSSSSLFLVDHLELLVDASTSNNKLNETKLWTLCFKGQFTQT